ncbi:MAG: DUF1732 domain-containing protein [Candidatus Omnitrophota bacterium]|nr:MAG: DUF1732 domain-containing protein [Candidatus Omnitrophota bacterium]
MKSMTAYAYVSKRKDSQVIQLVFRSLNYKYLDVFVHNLSVENVLLEEKIKKEIKKKVHRGRIEVYVFLRRPAGQVHIDERNLLSYISQINKIAKKYHLNNDLNISNILGLPQVMYWQEKERSMENLILPAVREGVKKLVEFKKRGGAVIKRQMSYNVKKIKTNVEKIKKIKPKIGATNEDNSREDIDEEISLISFYVNRLEKKIYSGKANLIGKSIDFLTQEILRELNAASSKTKNKNVASSIVDAKSYLERIREQAQNIE